MNQLFWIIIFLFSFTDLVQIMRIDNLEDEINKLKENKNLKKEDEDGNRN